MNLRRRLSAFLGSEDGVAATEYAVMTSAILGGIIVMMTAFGEAVDSLYVAITAAI